MPAEYYKVLRGNTWLSAQDHRRLLALGQLGVQDVEHKMPDQQREAEGSEHKHVLRRSTCTHTPSVTAILSVVSQTEREQKRAASNVNAQASEELEPPSWDEHADRNERKYEEWLAA